MDASLSDEMAAPNNRLVVVAVSETPELHNRSRSTIVETVEDRSRESPWFSTGTRRTRTRRTRRFQ